MQINITKGQDLPLTFRIRKGDGHEAPEKIVVTENALTGATTLRIDRDHPEFASGTVFILGEHILVTTGAVCLAGATSMTVVALAGPINARDELEQLRDLTGYTISLEILRKGSDATPMLTKAGVVPAQTGADYGNVTFAIVKAETVLLDDGALVGAVWRTDSATERPLAYFDVQVREKGFL